MDANILASFQKHLLSEHSRVWIERAAGWSDGSAGLASSHIPTHSASNPELGTDSTIGYVMCRKETVHIRSFPNESGKKLR